MAESWVAIPRRSFRDFETKFRPALRASAVSFWLKAVLRANWEATHLDGTPLARGQFVYGREEMAQELGISVQKLRTIVKHLKNMGEMTIETTSKGTIATVVYYETYAGDHRKNDQQNDQRTTSERPASDHSEQTNKHTNQHYNGNF